MNFKELHKNESPLLIANVWDVASAKVAERLNFDAIATSSGAIASMLGYADGEEISFEELKYVLERIVKNVDLPLSVDLEAGYGTTSEEIAANIRALMGLGVVGINLEDSKVTHGKRSLLACDVFSGLLKDVIAQLKSDKQDVFINVRTDTFLLGLDNALEETLIRAKAYQKA
ncbi:MAG: isocitrate lyase/phosphoenolpyruvate mutase family protein, partial [Bacteroidota bacterium]